MKMDYHDFQNKLLNQLSLKFPETKIRIVYNSDFVYDLVLEISQSGKSRKLKPYNLYSVSENYDKVIDNFLSNWERTIGRY